MNMEDIYETGPMVYSPYLRRLESLTIRRCYYKGSTFTLSVGPARVELAINRMAARYLTKPPVCGVCRLLHSMLYLSNNRSLEKMSFIPAQHSSGHDLSTGVIFEDFQQL